MGDRRKRTRAWPWLILFAALLTTPAPAQTEPAKAAAIDYLGRGKAAFRVGDIAAATRDWSEAIRLCRLAGAADIEAEALTRRGEAYRMFGHLQDARYDLAAALAKAEQSGDAELIAASSGALGNLAFLARRSAVAEPLLNRSRDLAHRIGNSEIVAASANDLGNLYAAGDRVSQAAAAYDEAIASADAAHDVPLAATAEINAARLALQRNDVARAAALLTRAVDRLEQLPPSYDGGMALIAAGSAITEYEGALSPSAEGTASRVLRAAAAAAEATHSKLLASEALGSQGRLDERQGRLDRAAQLTNQALFAAQQAVAPELSARWEWQQARLLRRQGQIEPALLSYRRAVADLQSVRQYIPVEYRGGHSSYYTTYGPLYLEFTDLLLGQTSADPRQTAPLIREARDTIEQLKETELQDYFRDSCITAFEAKRRSIDTIAPGTAVLYPIVLADRTEVLVSFGEEQSRFTIAIGAKQLREQVLALRQLLEKRTTNEYLVPARELYERIIRPLEPVLARHRIDTLVIVPDSVLRLIPFAALFDGEHFVVERYATAVAPSLHLVDPKPLSAAVREALALGVSEGVQGFSRLPNVAHEVLAVRDIEGGKSLLNGEFSRARFKSELEIEPYNLVHIASHGEFGSDPSRTFVLAFDGRLTMDDLERDIKYGKYRESALELLTLSACQTAAGDDRAALGLAGIALKSGARSALATLWSVNDRSAGDLVLSFYRALQNENLSKAHALQAAQREMLRDPVFGHPSYWAPFLLIGNWL
jgi:CHAT domain-containing protein